MTEASSTVDQSRGTCTPSDQPAGLEDWFEHLVIRKMRSHGRLLDGADYLDQRRPHELYGALAGPPSAHDFLLIGKGCLLRPLIDALIDGYEAGRSLCIRIDQMESPLPESELRALFVETLECLGKHESEDWRRGFAMAARQGFSNHENLPDLVAIARDELLLVEERS